MNNDNEEIVKTVSMDMGEPIEEVIIPPVEEKKEEEVKEEPKKEVVVPQLIQVGNTESEKKEEVKTTLEQLITPGAPIPATEEKKEVSDKTEVLDIIKEQVKEETVNINPVQEVPTQVVNETSTIKEEVQEAPTTQVVNETPTIKEEPTVQEVKEEVPPQEEVKENKEIPQKTNVTPVIGPIQEIPKDTEEVKIVNENAGPNVIEAPKVSEDPNKPKELNPYFFDCPPEFKPIKPLGYLGYHILYNIPLIGFIMIIIHSFSKKNYNRRNFARYYLITFILLILILGFVIFYFNINVSKIIEDTIGYKIDLTNFKIIKTK